MKRDCACPRARHQHGTYAAYNSDRCRCDDCRNAKIAYQRKERKLRAALTWTEGRDTLLIDATGTHRRLSALAAIGWSYAALAERLGISKRAVSYIHTYRMISVGRHQQVIDLYDELWDQPQHGHGPDLVRQHAKRQGWLPPMAWDDDAMDKTQINVANAMHATREDYVHTILPEETGPIIDEIAIQEAISGRRVSLTRPELSGAAAILDGMGHSAEFIAERLGVAARTVVRMRGKRAA